MYIAWQGSLARAGDSDYIGDAIDKNPATITTLCFRLRIENIFEHVQIKIVQIIPKCQRLNVINSIFFII